MCLEAWITNIWAPIIGAHTYQLSVSLKLQNRDRIRKFPRSAFSAQSCFALLPPLSVSLWPFVQSSAGLINHTHSGMQWHRWEHGGFIITALGWGVWWWWWWWWARPEAFCKTGEHRALETGIWIHSRMRGGIIATRYRWLNQQRHPRCVCRQILRQMAFRRVKRMSCWSSSYVWLHVSADPEKQSAELLPGDFHMGLPFVVFN